MPDQNSPKSPWRLSVPVSELSSTDLANAAVQLQIEGVSSAEDLADPGIGPERTALNKLIRSIMESSVAQIAAGGTSAVELGDRPEQFFQRARTKIQEHEKKSQETAIKEFLGIEPDGELLLSEQELVAAAIRASKDLGGRPDYSLTDLIRDGIRRVGQEMISNAANRENLKPGSKVGATSPGAKWDKYEASYQKLQLQVGTPAWEGRKPYITFGYIATDAKTNVIQIRRWAEATGKKIVGRPDVDRGDDPTAGCNIVDEKL